MSQELNLTGTVTHESGAPVQIKVERGQRGGYGWEIDLRGSDETELMSRIAAIDARLRDTYLQTDTAE